MTFSQKNTTNQKTKKTNKKEEQEARKARVNRRRVLLLDKEKEIDMEAKEYLIDQRTIS